jgi:membrane fusion protein, multidrug efflux system
MPSSKLYVALLSFIATAPAFAQNAPHVELAKVESHSLSRTVPLTGELTPYLQTDIEARVPGYVDRVLVDRGTKVRRGELLVQLSAPEMGSQSSAAEASLHQAEADADQAAAEAAAATSTYERILDASKTPGAVAGNELIQTEKQKDAANALANSRKAAVRSATDRLAATKQMQAYLHITAPFDGIITDRFVHPGMMVDAGAHQPLLRLQQTAHLRLVVPVPETYVGTIVNGKAVQFHVPAQPGKIYSGTIARVPGSLDQQSRSMMVELDVFNRDGTLAPGMYPTVDWPASSGSNLLFVPATSVVTTTEKTFVIVAKNKHAHWTSVRKGPGLGEQVSIQGAISPGDLVVKRATDEIRDGSPLN